MHDENSFRSQLQKDPRYAESRKKAMARFAKAAELYGKAVPDLDKEEIGTQVFDLWFYASLGECDLGMIYEETSSDPTQPKKIRQAILSLPGKTAEKHMSIFANKVFIHMSAAKPSIKFRYLRGAFEIVGDHKQAHEARKVYDYYNDLVTELKLDTQIDGSDVVSSTEPFGVFVNIRHTKEIERESGGFGKYLQNQNSSRYYYYNYGRPNTDYRERFEEMVHKVLDEHYEVLSIAFQSEKVHSRATEQYGWRTTPYAYLLLKPRGKEVDRIQPLRLDFDFLDTSGYVVLPIESPALGIEVTDKKQPPRPIEKLEVTQILDERQANEGKLVLEVKATGHGLVPSLETILDPASEDFEVAKVEDQGLAVSKFAEDAEKNCVVSERSWLVTLAAKEGLAERPKKFTFVEPKLEVAKSLRQRYDDADLIEAEAVVSLEQEYGEPSRAVYWATGGVVLAIVVLAIGGWLALRSMARSRRPADSTMPKTITPFSVLSILRAAQQNQNLSDTRREELLQTIRHIEQYYFVETGGNGDAASSDGNGKPDLTHVARVWSKTLRSRV